MPDRDYDTERHRGLSPEQLRLQADWFRRAMRHAGMDIYDLARKTGFSVPTLTDWTKGNRVPGGDNLRFLADVMDCQLPMELISVTKDLTSRRVPAVVDAMARFYHPETELPAEPTPVADVASELGDTLVETVSNLLDLVKLATPSVDGVCQWLKGTELTADDKARIMEAMWAR
jgi:transcriptional regulator with XRE-family HTH domain